MATKKTKLKQRQRSKVSPMLGIRDVARRAGVHEKRIRLMRQAGLLPEPSPVSTRGKYLWHAAVIEKWLKGERRP